MEQEVDVTGILNQQIETTPSSQPKEQIPKEKLMTEKEVYTGKLLQTNDSFNTHFIWLGLVLCGIVWVCYRLKKISE